MTDPERRNFTVVPNIADDADLSVYAFRLYVHIRRVAGDDGSCWQSTRTLAEACRMSAGMVGRARAELVDGNWITLGTKPVRGGQVIEIRLTDRWQENNESVHVVNTNEEKRSRGEHLEAESVHTVNTLAESVHVVNRSVHVVNESISNDQDIPIGIVRAPRKRGGANAPPTPPEIRTALADVCLIDLDGGTKADILQVNTTAATLWKQAQAKKADAADVVTGIHRTADYCRRKVFPFSKGERLKPSAIQSNWRAAYEEASHGAIRSNGRIHDDTGAAATPIRYKSTIAKRNGSDNRDGDRLSGLPPVDRTETNEGVIQGPARAHLE